MLELKNITKDYPVGDGKVHALRGVSVSFRENEFVSILGHSGCGKTTLLNIIGGLDRYSDGDLIIDGVSTKEYRDRDWDTYRNHSIGFVFQTYNLIPHQNVLANVELALTISGISRKERRKRAKAVLEKVGLGDQLTKKPNQLSGGQMQRVAIARALVNNPSILLADEPTGALDTETSVQIMELLKEVAEDRLVIMVTHNPELAQEYSTRIIRLVDGKITDDTMPYEAKSEPAKEKKKVKKPSMSFFTALSLSFKNLMTKKTRTILISFAGSIGIIGIALILSMSNGVQNLINRMESETLSSYPITLEKTSMDMSAMMTMGQGEIANDVPRDEDHVYSIGVMNSMLDVMLSGSKTNNLADFKKYIESGESNIDELTSDINYLYDTPLNIYRLGENGKVTQVNPNHFLTDLGMIQESETTGSLIQMSPISIDVWQQLIDNAELLNSQYDVIAGKMPEKYNEVVLIVDEDNQFMDFTLYSLGLLDAGEVKNALVSTAEGKEVSLDTGVVEYDFDEMIGLKFKLLTNTDVFVKEGNIWLDKSEDDAYMLTLLNRSEDIEVVGIIRPAEDASVPASSGVLGYRSDLMTHLINKVNTSQIVMEQQANPEIDVFTAMPFATDAQPQSYTMEQLEAMMQTLSAQEQAQMDAYIGQLRASGMDDNSIATQLMNSMMESTASTYEKNLSKMGVADLENPSGIQLYPVDFEAKDKLSDLIDAYNADLPENEQLAYTDYIGLMISSITTIVNAVSYVLIAFVAVSLVVSSIMIGIITYISVLERTREIGVLRSIGASKRDISRVFNAETLTIGLTAGLFGIGLTLLLILPINAIIESLTSLASVASLPMNAGVILVGISMLLTFIAGLIPAKIASKKDPVIALRTE
ncbi:MAG: ABC transporter ATP-binding protein/permease [Ruminococcaceae bacterium]|nr:ABC transporter ATP-binding protein/permease [Oscillospiraceae bacterium]